MASKEKIALEEKTTLMEKLGKVVNIAANAIMMNVLFLVACIPLVTIGAAWNALFSAVRYTIRGDRWFEGFKAGFKTRFWRSTLSWIIMLIPIGFFILSDVVAPLLTESGELVALNSLGVETIVRLVFACLITLMLAGFNGALILLNVYIPTKVGDWVSNGAKMFFKVPLQLAFVGLLMWFPLLLAFLLFQYFFYFIMVFIVAYYMLVAMGITMLMKNTLIEFLQEARTEGTLLQEEGKQKEDFEESSEDK